MLHKLLGNSNGSVAPLQEDLNDFGIFVGGGQGIDDNPFGFINAPVSNQNSGSDTNTNQSNELESDKAKKELSEDKTVAAVISAEEKKEDKNITDLSVCIINDFGGVYIGHQ